MDDYVDTLRELAERPSLYPEEQEAIHTLLGRLEQLEQVYTAAGALVNFLKDGDQWDFKKVVELRKAMST